jgi:hypothetical protein
MNAVPSSTPDSSFTNDDLTMNRGFSEEVPF